MTEDLYTPSGQLDRIKVSRKYKGKRVRVTADRHWAGDWIGTVRGVLIDGSLVIDFEAVDEVHAFDPDMVELVE